MSDATLARMEHGKYVGVRGEPRRDGVYVLRKRTLYVGLSLGFSYEHVACQVFVVRRTTWKENGYLS